VAAQVAIGGQDRLLQIRRQWCGQQQGAGGGTSRLQPGDVAAVEAVEDCVQLILQRAKTDQVPVGGGGGGEPAGNPHALRRQFADHLPEGGVLAAHLADRFQTHRLQRQHQGRGYRVHGGEAVRDVAGRLPLCDSGEAALLG